jgi:hypothetical protein
MLTEENKLRRMELCLSERGANGLFKDMYAYIHVDENMFLLTKEVKRYIILAEGKEAMHTNPTFQRSCFMLQTPTLVGMLEEILYLMGKFLLQDPTGTDQPVPFSGSPIR